LAQVLGQIPRYKHPEVLVGYDTADDAGVYKIDDERALVQTVDFFTPIVDDPHLYGCIAAANSLSDVYAMGGVPITAMAITCFPEKGLDLQVLAEIMKGGAEKLQEAGVALLGGHSVTDPEIKFGYSVTGLIHPRRILTNAGARPGDVLVLTKPLGIGILTSGIKFNKTSQEAARKAIEVMSSLNRSAAEIMMRYNSHAATDVTGNGLLGHAFEMANASNVSLHIDARKVPYIDEAYSLAKTGLLPRTIASTWEMIQPFTEVSPVVAEPLKNILLDPQTSGGLLISLDSNDLVGILGEMSRSGVEAAQIGSVKPPNGPRILVQ
jgi:selenide, water dikinase